MGKYRWLDSERMIYGQDYQTECFTMANNVQHFHYTVAGSGNVSEVNAFVIITT